MKKSLFAVILAYFVFCTLNAQDLVLVPDPVFQISKNQLFNLTLMNNGQQSGMIKIDCKVLSNSGKLILNEQLTLSLNAGESKRIEDKSNRLQSFIDSKFRSFYVNGILPPLDYQICYQAYFLSDINYKAKQCVEVIASDFISVTPFFPLDNQEVRIANPSFSWNNLLVSDLDVTYNFILVEVKDKQNPMIALRRELPLVHIRQLTNSFLDYPLDAQSLENDKQYAWQIGINLDGETFAKSDAFSFHFVKNEQYIEFPKELSYVELTRLPTEAKYFAVGEFKFTYFTELETSLNISLTRVKNSKTIKVEVDKLKCKIGDNKFNYDLKDQVYLRHKDDYLLKVKDEKNNEVYVIEFTYINPDYIK